MIFNEHFRLKGTHAKLSASVYHWIRYDDDKFDAWFNAMEAARRGDELHELAAALIKAGVKLERKPKTLNMYVNDAIGFRMRPEQILRGTAHAFGTADACTFERNTFRCHDLKTGVTPASFDQLKIYLAYFCMEYLKSPFEIKNELRIYQNDEKLILVADPDEIAHIMDKAKRFSMRIDEYLWEEQL